MLEKGKDILLRSSNFDEQSVLIANPTSLNISRIHEYTSEITVDAENHLHPLASYLLKYVIEKQPIPEKLLRKNCRKFAIAMSIIVACASGIPYIKPSRDALERHDALGWIVAISTIFSFGAGSTWAWLNIMREFEPRSPEEDSVITGDSPRIIRLLFANLLGSLATLPSAYAVYKFNNKLIYPIIAFTAGVATNIYALYTLYDGKKLLSKGMRVLKRWRPNNLADNTILTMTENLGQMLSKSPMLLLNAPSTERTLVMSSLYCKNQWDPQKHFELFLKEIIKLNLLNQISSQNKKWGQGWPRFLFKSISIIFPISFSIVNATLAYESSKLIYDNTFFSIIYTILTVVPYMSIEFLAAIKTFEDIFDRIFNCAIRQHTISFSQLFYPKINLIAQFSSILLGLIPSVNRIYITLNTIENKGKIPLTIIGALGGVIFQTFSLMDLKNQVLIKYSESSDNNGQKELAHFFKSINQFIKIYENTDLETRMELIASIQDSELMALVKQKEASETLLIGNHDSSSFSSSLVHGNKFKFFRQTNSTVLSDNDEMTNSHCVQPNMCTL